MLFDQPVLLPEQNMVLIIFCTAIPKLVIRIPFDPLRHAEFSRKRFFGDLLFS